MVEKLLNKRTFFVSAYWLEYAPVNLTKHLKKARSLCQKETSQFLGTFTSFLSTKYQPLFFTIYFISQVKMSLQQDKLLLAKFVNHNFFFLLRTPLVQNKYQLRSTYPRFRSNNVENLITALLILFPYLIEMKQQKVIKMTQRVSITSSCNSMNMNTLKLFTLYSRDKMF